MMVETHSLQVSSFELEKGGQMEKKKPKTPSQPKTKKQPTTQKFPLGKNWCDYVIKQFWDLITQAEFLYFFSLVFSAATSNSSLLFGPTRQYSQYS